MRSNCVIFALALYWRRKRHAEPRRIVVEGERYLVAWHSGGRYILIRTSRLGSWLPHVLYAERRSYGWRVVSFKPVRAARRLFVAPWFAGVVAWGD